MKTIQITFVCLMLLIVQALLSDAKTPKPVVIPAPDGVASGWGHSVDISGKTLIAGYTSYTGNKGGVFILEQKGKKWEVLNHFRTQNDAMRDWFGHDVAVSGNTAVISAYEFGGNKVTAGWVLGGGPGRIYAYRRGAGGFFPVQNFKAADAQNEDRFGYAVDLSGEHLLVVGSPYHDEQKGAVYVYVQEEGKWVEKAKLQADDAVPRARLGWDVGVDGDTIIAGAPLTAAPERNSGAAYVFKRQGDDWVQVAKLTPEDGDGGDAFGFSVDVSKDRVIVGASRDENDAKKRGSGSAYIFSSVGDDYIQEAKLNAKALQEDAGFGVTVALDINRALVGAPTTDTKVGNDSGAAYAFLKVGADWVLQVTIIPKQVLDQARGQNLTSGDNMGSAVALDGVLGRRFNYAAIGVRWAVTANGVDAGSVYVFDTEDEASLNLPLSVEPRGDLALTMFGNIKRTALLQNFPNPFNPETWIPYTLARAADVNIRIYNIQGKLVRQLDVGQQPAGRYLSRETAVYWNGKDHLGKSVSSGVYFYTLKADAFSDTRRMVILK
ncbi:T9SS type A sorting domain-containing protein [Candidatus Poribacteria bacterium]|nr:T9SS type A sorting domain-containing protein [Candidatus Poribacteria bacterium]